jgi:predicted HTH domain antitoxin
MAYDPRFDDLPDVRDGLNRKERIILYCLKQTQEEFNNRNVPTITLYGRVVELIDISQEEFQSILSRLVGLTRNTDM